MKFSANHSDEFNMPKMAWLIGFLQFSGGLLTEAISIIYISTIDVPIDVIIKFIALGSMAQIDNFYAAALPAENKVKKNFDKAKIQSKNHRRAFCQEDKRPCGIKFLNFVTKCIRLLYASWCFYFLPFTILWLPYLAPDYDADNGTGNTH